LILGARGNDSRLSGRRFQRPRQHERKIFHFAPIGHPFCIDEHSLRNNAYELTRNESVDDQPGAADA
jgi:hypothetical protein